MLVVASHAFVAFIVVLRVRTKYSYGVRPEAFISQWLLNMTLKGLRACRGQRLRAAYQPGIELPDSARFPRCRLLLLGSGSSSRSRVSPVPVLPALSPPTPFMVPVGRHS